jgi:hypothetical protein
MDKTLSRQQLHRFLEECQSEKSWRIAELAHIKKLISELEDSGRADILKKMAVPYLYAHWEGFCVASFRLLYEYLNRSAFQYEDLNFNLITLANSKSYDYLKGKHSFDQKVKFTSSFIHLVNHSVFKIEGKVETNSNVNYKVMENLFRTLGIETTMLSTYKKDLDTFVQIRNAIAHGENSIELNSGQLEDYFQLIYTMMDEIILEFERYFVNHNYRRENKVAV